MKPIGLTLKNIRVNPYTQRTSGEIMLVHMCLACGRISCNRIAGDDNAYSIITLLTSTEKPDVLILGKLKEMSINLLTPEDKEMVARALMGNQWTG